MTRLRIPDYDYRQPNAFFVTILAFHRQDLFGIQTSSGITTNRLGDIIHAIWHETPAHPHNIQTDAFIVMPNHVHGILWTTEAYSDHRPEGFGNPVAHSLPTAIRSFKSAVTRAAHRDCGFEPASPWQPRYWLHIIRTEARLNRIRHYIETNPQRSYR